MNTEILRLKNIHKTYNSGQVNTVVLSDVSFSVSDGEYLSITGPSGCGKSTLLNIMGLLDTPDEGEYYIDGIRVSDMGADQRAEMRSRRIGFVFQAFNLIDEYTLLENVALPLKYRGDRAKQRQARALECLERVKLVDRAQSFPNQLSGGQQQRVSIARALAADSGVMLVDEPTGNLDSENGDLVMALLQDVNRQGTTICLVTHDLRYAEMAHRRIVLLDGRINGEHALAGSADLEQ